MGGGGIFFSLPSSLQTVYYIQDTQYITSTGWYRNRTGNMVELMQYLIQEQGEGAGWTSLADVIYKWPFTLAAKGKRSRYVPFLFNIRQNPYMSFMILYID